MNSMSRWMVLVATSISRGELAGVGKSAGLKRLMDAQHPLQRRTAMAKVMRSRYAFQQNLNVMNGVYPSILSDMAIRYQIRFHATAR